MTLTKIKELLRENNISEALENLKEIETNLLSQNEYGLFCLFWSECCIDLADYDKVLINEALEIFRFSNDTENFANSLALRGLQNMKLGKFENAKQDLLEAYVHYKRCNMYYASAQTLNRLSFISKHLGDVENSIRSLRECIEILLRIEENDKAYVIRANLAHMFLITGALSYSTKEYQELHHDLLKQDIVYVYNYYFMSSIPYALRGDLKIAHATISKAKQYLGKYKREDAIYYENLGLIEILGKNYKKAEDVLTKGLDISMEIAPESALVSQIKRLFGDLYLATEKYDLAEKYTSEALEVATKINERVEIAACYRIQAQLAKHSGQHDKARELYKQAIDLFNLIGARYELAVTRYLAGTSDLFHNGERSALLHLAREYFESENIQHYLDKINPILEAVHIKKPKLILKDSSEFIAISPVMKKIKDKAEYLADTGMSLLLTGETGTGKDTLAKYIHLFSNRPGKFVSINTAAIPDTMFEAELFGYKKGAFTGADNEHIGLFEEANNGTLYLNEIGKTSLDLQAKLLDVLENHTIRRVGETEERKVDFRLIVATNSDLEKMIIKGTFLPDLYFRIKDERLHIPSLSEHREDIPALVKHFLGQLDPSLNGNGFGKVLSYRNYEGNVRDLQSEVKRLYHASRENIDEMIRIARSEILQNADYLRTALDLNNWNKSKVARLLGVSDVTIGRYIKRFDLDEKHSEVNT